ncbi:MAG: hypothetical protein INR73_26445 [Williamsia sp.]|nr:hypothetical protein [Williamsia sp.]
MKTQNFQNHIRFYPLHHFILLPLLIILFIASVVCIFRFPDRSFEFAALALIFFLILWVAVMLRQHYALSNQNRIVRLEMRLRYYQLTRQRFEPIEQQLTFNQLAALRFASDEELTGLINRALKENLSPKEIKQSVKDWQPDYMRV